MVAFITEYIMKHTTNSMMRLFISSHAHWCFTTTPALSSAEACARSVLYLPVIMPVAEAGNGQAPIGLVAVGATTRAGNLGAVPSQPRAAVAADDAAFERGPRGHSLLLLTG